MQMQVTVPLGAQQGQSIQVGTPSGPMLVQVPAGAMPGSTFVVTVPPPQQQQYGMPLQQQQQPRQPAGYIPPSYPPQPTPQVQQNQMVAPLPPSYPPQNRPPMQQSQMAAPLLAEASAPLTEPIQVAMGQPVSELMPQVAPAASLTDTYSSFHYVAEQSSEAGMHHAATWDAKSGLSDAASASAPLPMGQPVFYSDEQLAVLNQQPPPIDYFATGVKHGMQPTVDRPIPTVAGASVASDARTAVARPVVTTASGVPVVVTSSTGLSGAATTYDGMHGLKSCDPRLQDSVDELLLFFNTHNSRPLLGCAVEGWHHETRTRRRRVDDGDGKHHWETETYVEKVTDFQYKIDLTPFVYPVSRRWGRAACARGGGGLRPLAKRCQAALCARRADRLTRARPTLGSQPVRLHRLRGREPAERAPAVPKVRGRH